MVGTASRRAQDPAPAHASSQSNDRDPVPVGFTPAKLYCGQPRLAAARGAQAAARAMTRMVRTNFLRLLTLLLAESGSSRAPLHISPHRGGPSPDSLAESPRVPGRAVAGKLLYEAAVLPSRPLNRRLGLWRDLTPGAIWSACCDACLIVEKKTKMRLGLANRERVRRECKVYQRRSAPRQCGCPPPLLWGPWPPLSAAFPRALLRPPRTPTSSRYAPCALCARSRARAQALRLVVRGPALHLRRTTSLVIMLVDRRHPPAPPAPVPAPP